jgi:thiol-disulfide isomerase/thioredoxin
MVMVVPARAQSQPREIFFVAGSVLDEVTKEPVGDAKLQFLIDGESDPQKRVRHVSTDAQGHFRLEVPVGSVQLWFPELKPGYWLDRGHSMTSLSTSPEQPVATLDIAAKRGRFWPVQIVVEGGIPDNVQSFVSVMEIEDDDVRIKLVRGEPVSFQQSPNQATAMLGKDGSGAFTECGKAGKLSLSVGVTGDETFAVDGIATEFLVDPAFNVTKVKTISPIAGTDSIQIVDDSGAKAVLSKASVKLIDGRPLLMFQLKRKKVLVQEFTGLIVDETGKPLRGVRVGSAVESSSGGGEWDAAANTDNEGRFCLRVPLVESTEVLHLRLVLNKEGYAGFESRKFPLPIQPIETIDVGKLTLPPGHSVPVRIVGGHGEPLAGAVAEPQDDYALRKLAIRTNAEGRGVLRNLPAGVVRVAISYAGLNDRAQIVVSAVDAENSETELRLVAPAAPPAADGREAKPLAVGQLAPELAIKEWTDGKERKLGDYRGRVVVLEFWGIWCGPCLKSIPAMQELAEKYAARDVVFLAIHTPDGNLEQINKLKRLKGWKTAVGVDRGTTISDGASAEQYGVRGFPTIMILGRHGKVAFNSDVEPEHVADFMQDMRQLASSLKIPWPIPEDDEEQAVLYMCRIQAALFSREIEKALLAGRK